MKKVIGNVLLLSSLLLLTACAGISKDKSAQPEQQTNSNQAIEQKENQHMLVLSSAEPKKVLPAFTTFAWDEDYSMVLSVADDKHKNRVKDYIREQLITYLQKKGYRYERVSMDADVVIGFLAALQDSLADKTTQTKFGLLPSKNKVVRPAYKKGTLLLNVMNSELSKVYWRSALVGFNDLQQQADTQNSERMQVILDSMLGGFPKAGR